MEPVRWAVDFPNGLSAGGVDGNDVRGVVGVHALKVLQVQDAFVQQRRRRIPELHAEFPVVGLQIALPLQASLKVKAAQFAVSVDHPHVCAVRHGSRRGHVLLVSDLVVPSLRLPPANLARLAVNRQQVELITVGIAPSQKPGVRAVEAGTLLGRRDEDGVTPDDRRRSRPARQLGSPHHILFRAPARRQASRAAGPVQVRAPPVRPIVGRLQGQRHSGYEHKQTAGHGAHRSSHAWPPRRRADRGSGALG